MTHDDIPTGLATTSPEKKSFSQRLGDTITVGHLLAAGVLAGFGAGFGSHALFSDSPVAVHESCDLDEMQIVELDVADTRPALGVELGTNNVRYHPSEAKSRCGKQRRVHRHARARGVRVGKVMDGSPAANAGLLGGDIIVRVNGHRLRSGGALLNEISRHEIGDEIKLHVHRGGERLDLDGKLGSYADIFR